MKWILVLFVLTDHGHPIASEEGRYDSMERCFYHRELTLLDEFQSYDGIPPNGVQLVCIPHVIEQKDRRKNND